MTSIDLADIGRLLPALGDRLDVAAAKLALPLSACPHLTGVGKFRFAVACLHHFDHVGLLCCYCSMRHTQGHNSEFELSCDAGCERVCFDDPIGSCGIPLPAANYRIRNRGRARRVRLDVMLGGFGICADCAGTVDHHPVRWAV